MSLYRLAWQRRDGTWVDENQLHSTKDSARQRAVYIAEIIDVPVRIINDWDGNITETIEKETG